MTTGNHDPLVYRLAQILIKLNQGEKLAPQALADEFGVNLRTIQRDLNERFAYLPLAKSEGVYHMDPAFLGSLSFRDIERFASLAGLKGLFPALDTDFLRELFDSRLQEAMLIHGHNYEDLQGRFDSFRRLQSAILEHRVIRFDYRKNDGSKNITAHPYKLINHGGIWYLAATDDGKPKAYSLGKIENLSLHKERYTHDPAIAKMLENEDSIWLNENKTEVVLKVAAPVAQYFQRRKLIAGQILEKELADGGLLISGKFAHPNQILPIVRYWMPHVRIVSPEGWQADMEQELRGYLDA